jgi:hypothetical protein
VEVRRRVEQLLAKLNRPVPLPESLRVLRAVQALEQRGTPPAREMLQALAQGHRRRG